MSLIDKAIKDFEGTEKQKIEVPEWGDKSGPAIIYFSPITVADEEKALALCGGADVSQIELGVQLLVLKAMDEAGKKCFAQADKGDLIQRTKSKTIGRLIAAMGADSVEKKKENLD